MGAITWLAGGLLATGLARIIPAGRSHTAAAELLTAVSVALLFGVAATALDFGGWNEPDWRAGLFCFFGGFGGAGLLRVAYLLRRPA